LQSDPLLFNLRNSPLYPELSSSARQCQQDFLKATK
jgi:hypothetical protein